METVKVDIQKLQLLNDRIAQTIEALNQVRMSVHGIPHTQQVPQWGFNPYATPSFGYTPSYSGQPQFAQPYGMQVNPFSPFAGGLPHSQVAPLQNPYQAVSPFQTGISHTAWDPSMQRTPWQSTPWQATPWQTRIAQTFPFVQYLQPPTIS